MAKDGGKGLDLTDEMGLLADAILGAGLPPEAEKHLHMAGLTYHNEDAAEGHLLEALRQAPDHAAVLIGLYRFYFYKNRLEDALEVAEACLVKAARENGLTGGWRRVHPDDADFGNFGAVLPRFFLFSLKGYAYLNMRLGLLSLGREAAEKILELDPTDKLGASVLIDVMDRMEAGDED